MPDTPGTPAVPTDPAGAPVHASAPGLPASLSRRGVVAAAGGAGLAAVLTACGSSDKSSGSSDTTTSGTSAGGSSQTSATPEPSASDSASASGGGTALARTSEIPVGGGRVFADQKVVVTQPAAGQFKGFSAVCTHQGCTVAGVSGGTIDCPCHGSKFHIADGSVANGPASAPLPPRQITVAGGEITLA